MFEAGQKNTTRKTKKIQKVKAIFSKYQVLKGKIIKINTEKGLNIISFYPLFYIGQPPFTGLQAVSDDISKSFNIKTEHYDK